MRSAVLIPLVVASFGAAQTVNTTYVTGLVNALNGAGYSSLTGGLSSLTSDPSAQSLLAQLPGSNKTIFAPTNDALSSGGSGLTPDVLSYHVISGIANTSNIATDPAKSVFRTLLNHSVYLEGNSNQVLTMQQTNTSQILICNQPNQTSATNPTVYENLLIYGVDHVLTIPGSMQSLLSSPNYTSFSSAAAPFVPTYNTAHGITIFVPSNQAFTNAQSALSGANSSTVASVIQNHVINGSTVYSPQLGSKTWTSAGGQKFSFDTNGSGTFVTSGSSTARIAESDVLTYNGVVHVLDGVLLNTQSDASAASSAYAGATSSAGTAAGRPTGTGPVGTGGSNGAVSVGMNPWSALFAAIGVAAGATLVL